MLLFPGTLIVWYRIQPSHIPEHNSFLAIILALLEHSSRSFHEDELVGLRISSVGVLRRESDLDGTKVRKGSSEVADIILQ